MPDSDRCAVTATQVGMSMPHVAKAPATGDLAPGSIPAAVHPKIVPLLAWCRSSFGGWSRWHVPTVGYPDTAVRMACGRLVERRYVRDTKLSTRLFTLPYPEDCCGQCWQALDRGDFPTTLTGKDHP